MSNFNFSKGDTIRFKRVNNGETREYEGEIATVDFADPANPYYVNTQYGGYWIEESEIIEKVSDAKLDRIEAKLDAIIKHFGVPFEL